MANPSSSLPEGQALNRPLCFSGTNFNYWKTRMIMHIQSTDYEVWKIICEGPKAPTKTVDGLLVPKLESE